MQSAVKEHWQITKPAVTSTAGLVASQHHLASDVGAQVLRQGGNAIDAAIATGLTLGTVEPWMSGIGGGGYMTIYLAKERSVKVIEFGMRAPLDSVPEDYPLAPAGTNASDSFNWPAVVGDVNIHGPLSIAVPGYIKGISLALETFGTMDWKDVIEPACQHAEFGLPIDWFSAAKINTFARGLNLYDETRMTYLADGLPPVGDIEGDITTLQLGRLDETYRRLQSLGPDEYYQGELAEQIAEDLKLAGSRIRTKDLAGYRAKIVEPLMIAHRGTSIHVAGGLTAGPSLERALQELASKLDPGSMPDTATYMAFAESLFAAYDYRLQNLGEGPGTPTNTTHICASDKEGNVVSLTQTIMSGFGSRIMLPQTGILMNNGMMWFDPRPGGPNSVLGGRHPLCNMCPVIGVKENGNVFAAGACGGRKIFPAVFQLVSFLSDYNMDVNTAAHYPRLDISGTDMVTLMESMDTEIIDKLADKFTETRVRPNGVSPNLFALPQLLETQASGEASAACFIPSPHAKVSSAG